MVFQDKNNNNTIDFATDIEEVKNFYAFGLEWETPSSEVPKYRNGYNDKERVSHTKYLDFGARNYIKSANVFDGPDPLSSSMPSWSPFSYGYNNPLRFIDPDGRFPIETIWDAINVVADAGRAIYHAVAGNTEKRDAALQDLALDGAALAIPYVPAGISKLRYADEAAELVKGTDHVVDAGKEVSKLDGLKQIGPAGDAGATVTKQIPEGWTSKTTKKGKGTQFLDPDNPSANNVRVMQGNPQSPHPSQKVDYVKRTKGGSVVDKSGNPAKHNSPEAHIKKDEFKYDQ